MKLPSAVASAILIVALSGCGHKDTDPGPGGVTVGEARTLDEAAAMLDERQLAPQDDASLQAPTSSPSDSAPAG